MCGVAGIWELSGQKLNLKKLSKFTDSLVHRGPDDFGYFIDNNTNFGIGHRRLSILDLSSEGKQPMSYMSERYWITYNGEIFNFLELKTKLTSLGYKFKTETDTEIILASFHEWGEDCLNKFNGMWAFAIYDKIQKKCFLSRDRFGIKPLYYSFEKGGLFAFASETSAFSALDKFNKEFSILNVSKTINNVFEFGNSDETIYQNIKQLKSGHFMTIEKDQKVIIKKWWETLDNLNHSIGSYKKETNDFKDILISSCKLRLRSDTPICSALSGGLDSSSIYCLINHISDQMDTKRLPRDYQSSFTAAFKGTTLDESKYAKKVNDFIKKKGNFVEVNDDNLINNILQTTKSFDNIYLTPISIGTDLYGNMKENGYKISLDGHGVDEMMAGYPYYIKIAYDTAKALGNETLSKEFKKVYLELFSENKRKFEEEIFKEKKIKEPTLFEKIEYRLKKAFNINQHKNSILLKQIEYEIKNESENFPKFYSKIDKELYNSFHNYTLPTILRNFDRMSMLKSVEIRMPFMDYRIVSKVFSLPFEYKVNSGFTKKILRDAMKGIVPEEIRLRKEKIGLNAPMIEWFSNQLSEFILDEINSKTFLKSDIWNGKYIASMATKKIKNKNWKWNEATQFWTILNSHILLNK